MTAEQVEVTTERRKRVASLSPRLADRRRSVVILGRPTETNCALAAAFVALGQRVQLAGATAVPRLGAGDLALARLDVLPTLDGIEPALSQLPRLQRRGGAVLNGPLALTPRHDNAS